MSNDVVKEDLESLTSSPELKPHQENESTTIVQSSSPEIVIEVPSSLHLTGVASHAGIIEDEKHCKSLSILISVRLFLMFAHANTLSTAEETYESMKGFDLNGVEDLGLIGHGAFGTVSLIRINGPCELSPGKCVCMCVCLCRL